jgi:hypothetical protein
MKLKEKKHHKKKEKRSSRKEGKKDRKEGKERVRPAVKLTADDYFLRAKDFRVYLRSKGKSFEALTSEKARGYFDDYIAKYNKGKLVPMFYTGEFPPSLLEEATHTQHRWGLSLSDADKKLLSSTTTAVLRDGNASSVWGEQQQQQLSKQSVQATVKPRVAMQDMVATAEQHGIDTEKPTGHAALLAKRKERGDAIHAAHKEREDRASGLELPDSVILGGDSSRDLEFLKQRQAQRASKQEEKIAVLQEKERQRDDAWKVQLGLPTDGSMRKITIAPRPPLDH